MHDDSKMMSSISNVKRGDVISFIFENHRKLFVWAIVLAVLIAFVRIWHPGNGWAILQDLITVLTLGVALFIWWTEQEEEWKKSLPKRLTVRFMFKDREVMRCEEAYLAGESDIRAWAQQLGGQMTADNRLSFFPTLEQNGPIVCYDKLVKCKYVLYDIKIILRQLPQILQVLWDSKESNDGPFILWKSPSYTDSRFNLGTSPNPELLAVVESTRDLSKK
jgi:hypothetical protein